MSKQLRYVAVVEKPDVKAIRRTTQAVLLVVGSPILLPLLVIHILTEYIIQPVLNFVDKKYWQAIYWVEGKYISYKRYNEELEKVHKPEKYK